MKNIKKTKKQIIISSGFGNFHMLSHTAVGLSKYNRLNRVFCGLYPSKLNEKIFLFLPLSKNKKKKFFLRKEKINEKFIFQNEFSELLDYLQTYLSKFNNNLFLKLSEHVNLLSKNIYSNQVAKILKNLPFLDQNKIYHFRAGFGGKSIKIAKSLGYYTLCDHSIAHPSTIDCLVQNKGKFISSKIKSPSNWWKLVVYDINQADAVLVNSNFVKESFRYVNFKKKIHVLQYGLENKFFDFLKNLKKDKGNGKIKFLFAGAIVQRKGVDEIQEALGNLKDSDFELHIAGSLAPLNKSRYKKLLEDKRTFYHGSLNRIDLCKLMLNSDVFLFPSLCEGSARVIFEAMASGCAIITTKNTGSVVKHNKNGFIVPPGNIKKLANYINKSKKNKKLINKMGKYNSLFVKKKYNYDIYVKKLFKIYNQLK